MKHALLGIFFFVVFFILTPPFLPAHANVTACAVTNVGNPAVIPPLPPECGISAIIGVELPPNLSQCVPVPPEFPGGVQGEYCKMPPSLDGSYKTVNTWGAKEMIGVLYTVATNFAARYEKGSYLNILDISAHHGSNSEHDWGVAVDLTAVAVINGQKHCVADFIISICQAGSYDRQATIELGKLIVDTGYLDVIWYNDTNVNSAVYAYAYSKDAQKFPLGGNRGGRTGLRPVPGHDHHFHLDIDRTGKHNSSHTENFRLSKLKKCQTVPEVTGSC